MAGSKCDRCSKSAQQTFEIDFNGMRRNYCESCRRLGWQYEAVMGRMTVIELRLRTENSGMPEDQLSEIIDYTMERVDAGAAF